MFYPSSRRLKFSKSFALSVIALWLFALTACRSSETAVTGNENLKNYPPTILWAWERPEDLRFLDARNFGVAFLAQTLFLTADEIKFAPRRQPLKVAPEVFLIAVTRIETDKKNLPALSDFQQTQIIESVKKTLDFPNVRAVQIDFDVMVSEREFYRELMKKLRSELAPDISLTMTALASWCAGDVWFEDFPVDDVVPMAFRMGADDEAVRAFLASGKDWNSTPCRNSYGVALDEPVRMDFKPGRRIYVFNSREWRSGDLQRLPRGEAK